MLIDLRLLQQQSVSADPKDLRRTLADSPDECKDASIPLLLNADPDWARSATAAMLLEWLAPHPTRHLCLMPSLGDRALSALCSWYGVTRVCRPSLLEATWHCSDHPPQSAPQTPEPATRQSTTEALSTDHHDLERLAWLSPMPPQRSGITSYSLELLPHLAKYFQIDLITQEPLPGPIPAGASQVCSVQAFHDNPGDYQHILYHLGNSPENLSSVQLLESTPGAVMLHDFYLSHMLCAPQADQMLGGSCMQRLYHSHGYQACLSYQTSYIREDETFLWDYPCNLLPLQAASGVIVHSEESRQLAARFFTPLSAREWSVIPHLKLLSDRVERQKSRTHLGFSPDSFVVCSFGFLGTSKLSPMLLEAFLASDLARDPRCALVFAGSAGGHRRLLDQLSKEIDQARRTGRLQAEVRITGWLESEGYQSYLDAADAAVQLRTFSRGETSGTVLDCLGSGIPLIVNAHGSMREIPAECALVLPDQCSLENVQQALETLYHDSAKRNQLAARGLEQIARHHRPESCAALYATAIRKSTERRQRRSAIAQLFKPILGDQEVVEVANTLAQLLPPEPSRPQLFLDVSALAHEDLGSGVQRVVRCICEQLLARPPEGFRVEPVVAKPDGLGYSYARGFTTQLLDLRNTELDDSPILFRHGDYFLAIDLSHGIVKDQSAFYTFMRSQGVAIHFVVHDLLPCTLPDCFPEGTQELHEDWLRVVAACDGALCVSRSVASDLNHWLMQQGSLHRKQPFRVGWFHHGCDFNRKQTLSKLDRRGAHRRKPSFGAGPTVLMVGTIEPRKAYLDAVEAATLLWAQGEAFNLVIVGREGWTDLPQAQRRTIPKTIARIHEHPELNRSLYWFANASDAELSQLYQSADGLLSTSLGEGFGIPLIEAASYGLPLLLRDLPVFREVTEGHARYFSANADAETLAAEIKAFLAILRDPLASTAARLQLHPQSWQESADQLIRALGLEPGLERIPRIESPADDSGLTTVPVKVSRPRLHRRLARRCKRMARRILRRLRRRSALVPSLAMSTGKPLVLSPGAQGWYQELRRNLSRN